MSTTGRRILKIVGGLVIVAVLVSTGFWLGRGSLIAANFYPDRMRFLPMIGWGGLVSGVASVAMWALIIGLFVWGVGGLFNRPSNTGPEPIMPDSALDILQKRYARGEITKDEFDAMRRDVSG
ncbi:MAG: SHOCT domain-containing protein [Anaerolineae bacterium]